MNDAVDFHARLQQAVDQIEELVVHHLFPDAPQDRLVGDFVKASLDIALDDPGEARAVPSGWHRATAWCVLRLGRNP